MILVQQSPSPLLSKPQIQEGEQEISTSPTEKNSDNTLQLQTHLVNKQIRKKRRKTIKIHHKLPKLPDKSYKLQFDYLLCEKDKYLITPPLSSQKYFKNVKNIQINNLSHSLEINFNSIELDTEDQDLLIEKLNKYHGSASKILYQDLVKSSCKENFAKDSETKKKLQTLPLALASYYCTIREALQQCSLVILIEKDTLSIQKYVLSEKLIQILGFDDVVQLIQFVLRNGLPNFSIPEDYGNYVKEEFKQLKLPNEYKFRSKLSNIKGHSFIIQEVMKSHHYPEENIIMVIHNFSCHEKLQQNYDQIIKSSQEVIRYNQFKEFSSQIVQQYDKQYAYNRIRPPGQTRGNRKHVAEVSKVCKYRSIL